MTNQQILERAIQKAIDGGLDKYTFHSLPISSFRIDCEVGTLGKFISYDGEEIDVATIIFNHDFAKALWGGCEFCNPKANRFTKDHPNHWQYHLQQMVLADDPIKYLGENT